MSWVFDRLERHQPRRGPEWGSGGIFGLRFHSGVLYYTVAFDSEAHFIHRDRAEIYRFEHLGESPRSGGDTYNAVETVDEYIYFGGWVNAPALYRRGENNTSKIVFTNKFSHLHQYDVENREVRLLWKDSVHREDEWAAEVGDILYDPFNDKLLLMREDGHFNNGVYRVDRRNGAAEMLFPEKCLKAALVRDMACFGVGENYVSGLREIRFLDLVSDRMDVFGVAGSVDGQNFYKPSVGEMASAYNRVFAFVRGGVVVGNPYLDEPFTFVRLFDFLSFYAPFRTNSIIAAGGILVPYNAHHDAVYQPTTDEAKTYSVYTNTITGPSVLVYITPPMAKIVGTFGARITSVEKVGEKILLACDNSPNAGGPTVTPYDSGEKDFTVLDEEILQRPPPAAVFTVPLNRLHKLANMFGASCFGGVPLTGYRSPSLKVFADRANVLKIYEYDLSLPLNPANSEDYVIKPGKNIIDLDAFTGIVSFQLTHADPKAVAKINLV
ncbi:MAG: DUF2139 domain-containing protein [Candidatus Caldarchaeum sp.]|nr:DUF2139 domain-containing protein [Candidatus Caldarchaeum sp.]